MDFGKFIKAYLIIMKFVYSGKQYCDSVNLMLSNDTGKFVFPPYFEEIM